MGNKCDSDRKITFEDDCGGKLSQRGYKVDKIKGIKEKAIK
jgi:hypothetical protein